jgi:hypothetical protein
LGKHIVQIHSGDGCVYLYDADKKTLMKACDVVHADHIPVGVKETLDALHVAVLIKD